MWQGGKRIGLSRPSFRQNPGSVPPAWPPARPPSLRGFLILPRPSASLSTRSTTRGASPLRRIRLARHVGRHAAGDAGHPCRRDRWRIERRISIGICTAQFVEASRSRLTWHRCGGNQFAANVGAASASGRRSGRAQAVSGSRRQRHQKAHRLGDRSAQCAHGKAQLAAIKPWLALPAGKQPVFRATTANKPQCLSARSRAADPPSMAISSRSSLVPSVGMKP